MPLFASHAFRSCAARIVIGLSAVPFFTPFAQSMSGMPFVSRVYFPSPTTSVSPGTSAFTAFAKVFHGALADFPVLASLPSGAM